MTGVFTVHRGVFDHPLFEGEAYSRRDAWLWLVGNAVWKPTKVRVAGKIVQLERGQLAYSERFMAKAWMWSKSKVHRFLGRLKTEAMIELKTDHETNHITICNYDNYQFSRTADRTDIGPPSGPGADQERTKEEEGNKERKKDHINSAAENVYRETKSRKPSKVPLPENWTPSARARELAASLGVDVNDQEERFRDYLAANAVQYANYNSAFCNFVRNALRFSGGRGPPARAKQPSFEEIAATLGARSNGLGENGNTRDPGSGTEFGELKFFGPGPERGH